ncbi:MAG: DUF4278 domain-containing protein [Prochlorotrichaceae cyanobacterium]|jgi:hypothetical protein
MQLTYRGVAYEYTPPAVETKEGELAGRYRGLDWKFCNPTKQYVQQPSLDLVYRGVAYRTNAADGAAQTAPNRPVSHVVDRSRELMISHQRAIKTRQQAMLTRLAAQVGLPSKDAGAYWNRIQGKVHPSFRITYDRSAAAMS